MKITILFLILLGLLGSPLNWTHGQEVRKAFDLASNSVNEPESLSFQINYVFRPAGVGELKAINNGDILRSGDHYKIIFNSNKDCYVYIFQVDSSGQIFKLFPMESFKGVPLSNLNPVREGRTYVLPASDKAFLLDRQVGTERIYFIASTERNRELEDLYAELKDAGRRNNLSELENTRSKLNKYFRRRGIKVVPSEQYLEVPWRETGDLFSVMSQRLENLSKEKIHVLEFAHE
jgi:hypothetical protein